jgi:hypothetical protein
MLLPAHQPGGGPLWTASCCSLPLLCYAPHSFLVPTPLLFRSVPRSLTTRTTPKAEGGWSATTSNARREGQTGEAQLRKRVLARWCTRHNSERTLTDSRPDDRSHAADCVAVVPSSRRRGHGERRLALCYERGARDLASEGLSARRPTQASGHTYRGRLLSRGSGTLTARRTSPMSGPAGPQRRSLAPDAEVHVPELALDHLERDALAQPSRRRPPRIARAW